MKIIRPVQSDTITATTDGRIVVDVGRLFSKKHVQETMRSMRAKTRVVSRRQRPVVAERAAAV